MSEIVGAADRGAWSRSSRRSCVFLISALAETNRPPFDLPEAESELVAGYHTEYSGIRFTMFLTRGSTCLVTVPAIAVTLFLGGWNGPWFDALPWLGGLLWFLLKLRS